jgi:hypothetical protein
MYWPELVHIWPVGGHNLWIPSYNTSMYEEDHIISVAWSGSWLECCYWLGTLFHLYVTIELPTMEWSELAQYVARRHNLLIQSYNSM